jgi:hypothetical protein
MVWDFFTGADWLGATDEELAELAEAMGHEHQAVIAARVELCTRGHVRDSGERREGADGRGSVVWVVTGVKQ